MRTLWQDVRHGLRALRNNPGFATVAILSLALGIGANTTIFTVVNAVLLHPLPVADVARLVEVDTVDSKTRFGAPNAALGMSYPNYRDYRDHNSVFSGLSVVANIGLTLSGEHEPKQYPGTLVSANYFDVLGVKPALGRTFYADEDQKPGGNPVAVLSYSVWARQFSSDPAIVGRTLELNSFPYVVVGVAPRNFKGTLALADPDQIWIPVSNYPQALSGQVQQFFNQRRSLFVLVFGRLKPGIDIRQAEASLKTFAAALEREYPIDNAGRSVALTPLAEAAVGTGQRGQFDLAGALMMGVVSLVLLIACANLANLLLVQAAKREREMSLRAALGAGRGRLMRQVITESMLLAIMGGVAGLLLAFWGRKVLWSFRPPFLTENSIDLSLDWHVLLFTLGISVLTGLIFGVVPAAKASQANVAEALKVGSRGAVGFHGNRVQSALIVVEVALALVALVGAGLFVRSLAQAQELNPGFESQKLLTLSFDLGAARYDQSHGLQFIRDAIARTQALPGVARAAVASNPPLTGGFSRTTFPEGQPQIPGHGGVLVTTNDVSTGYLDTLRIPLLRGRDFTEFDRQGSVPVAVVTRAMADHFWPGQDAVGKRFTFFGDPALIQIVGVAANNTQFEIGESPQPVIYLPVDQVYSPIMTLHVRTSGNPEAVLAAVRAQVQSLNRNLALTNVQTIREIFDQGLWAPRMGAVLLSLFGAIALALATVGIYGVIAYSVAQRTREIGVRMALGARPADVRRLVVGEGMLLAGAGTVLGIVFALALGRVFSSLLYDVSATDPLTFVGVTLVLAVVALLACYIPAQRAMRTDPTVALRFE